MAVRDPYYDVKALSNTAMGELSKSPMHLKAMLDGKKPSSKAMDIGRWVHLAILEPEIWSSYFFVKKPGNSALAKKYNSAMQDSGSVGISQNEYDMIRGIVGRMLTCPWLKELWANYKDQMIAEGEYYWSQDVDGTGIKCKAKLDLVIPEANILIDFKTTRDAKPESFIKKGKYAYNYDRQMAWYLDACIQAGTLTADADCYFVAIEKEYPYAHSIVKVDKNAISEGREKYKALLAKYADVIKNRDWHGYGEATWEGITEQQLIDSGQKVYALEAGAMPDMSDFAKLLGMSSKNKQQVLTEGARIGSLRVKKLKR